MVHENAHAQSLLRWRRSARVALALTLLNSVAIPTALFGVIVGHRSLRQSKSYGVSNAPALVAVLLGWFYLFVTLLLAIAIYPTFS